MNKRTKGNIGENVACTYLERNGFTIIDRNYNKRWGEIDIIAKIGTAKGANESNQDTIHFFEVKSIFSDQFGNFSKGHTPEENVHNLKISHTRRAIVTYLDEKGGGLESSFQFHVLCVYLNIRTRRSVVRKIENIII